MYSVSEAYIAKMLDKIQTHRLVGTIDEEPFNDSDVIGVSYKNQCSQKSVNVGSVNIGVLKFTLLRDILDRGDYYGKEITISDGLKLEDESGDSVFEDVPIGVFYVAEAVRTAAGIDITAYDVMSKLDDNVSIDQTSGSVYSFCKYIETETGATFGMTEEECQALPNGTEIISPYEENDISTYRDLLSALASFVGGFAYANRSGAWVIKTFNDVSVISIPRNRRISGMKISDFETYYDTVSYIEMETKIVKVIGDGDGLIIKLGGNPFLQYGTPEAITRRVNNIVDSIKAMKYTPSDLSLLPAFVALDLGDVITLLDDFNGDDSKTCIMSVNWTYNKTFKVQCYGDNPNLRSAQSKAEKDISGIMQTTTKNEVTYYNFANIEPYNFGPEIEVSIASLRFTASQETTVKIMHEFIFDFLKDLSVLGSYELRYYLDEERLNYSPYESLSPIVINTTIPEEGEEDETIQAEIDPINLSITRDFFYVIRNVIPGIAHTWEVRIVAHGIENVLIDTDHVHITLEGQRLYGDKYFDGFIEAKDYISVKGIGGLEVVDISDAPNVIFDPALLGNGQDDVIYYDMSSPELIPIVEGSGVLAPHIYMDGGFFICTEDEEILCSEENERLITE